MGQTSGATISRLTETTSTASVARERLRPKRGESCISLDAQPIPARRTRCFVSRASNLCMVYRRRSHSAVDLRSVATSLRIIRTAGSFEQTFNIYFFLLNKPTWRWEKKFSNEELWENGSKWLQRLLTVEIFHLWREKCNKKFLNRTFRSFTWKIKTSSKILPLRQIAQITANYFDGRIIETSDFKNLPLLIAYSGNFPRNKFMQMKAMKIESLSDKLFAWASDVQSSHL